MKFFTVLCLFGFVARSFCDTDTEQAEVASNGARVLASKTIKNRYIVQGMDVVIRYNLYNVGDAPAVDLTVKGGSASKSDIEVVGGSLDMSLPRLAPGSNATHVVVMRPLKPGMVNFTSSVVSYRISDDKDSAIQIGHTSNPGYVQVMPIKDYDRHFSGHALDWLAFAVMTLPSLGIPFMLWFSSKSKYEAIGRAKKD